MSPTLTHLTLLTGDAVVSPRDGVDAAALTAVAALLRGGGTLPAPFERYRLVVVSNAPGALVAAVRAGHGDDADTLVVFGVARDDSPEARSAWRALCEMQAASPGSADWQPPGRPEAPWLAVAILPALATALDAAGWLADFERCVAWAWLDRRGAWDAWERDARERAREVQDFPDRLDDAGLDRLALMFARWTFAYGERRLVARAAARGISTPERLAPLIRGAILSGLGLPREARLGIPVSTERALRTVADFGAAMEDDDS